MTRSAFSFSALMVSVFAFGASAQVDNFPLGTVPENTEDGGFRYLEVAVSEGSLNVRSDPLATSAAIGRLERGAVLINLGCRADAGRAWCDVQPIMGGARGFVAADFLRPAVSPNGAPLRGPDDSALRAAQGDFDATGKIPCSQEAGQPMGYCDFSVARAGGGDATVIIKRPDNRTRAIFFRLGQSISANTSEADYGTFNARKTNDLSNITVGAERYEIPDAVVLGG